MEDTNRETMLAQAEAFAMLELCDELDCPGVVEAGTCDVCGEAGEGLTPGAWLKHTHIFPLYERWWSPTRNNWLKRLVLRRGRRGPKPIGLLVLANHRIWQLLNDDFHAPPLIEVRRQLQVSLQTETDAEVEVSAARVEMLSIRLRSSGAARMRLSTPWKKGARLSLPRQAGWAPELNPLHFLKIWNRLAAATLELRGTLDGTPFYRLALSRQSLHTATTFETPASHTGYHRYLNAKIDDAHPGEDTWLRRVGHLWYAAALWPNHKKRSMRIVKSLNMLIRQNETRFTLPVRDFHHHVGRGQGKQSAVERMAAFITFELGNPTTRDVVLEDRLRRVPTAVHKRLEHAAAILDTVLGTPEGVRRLWPRVRQRVLLALRVARQWSTFIEHLHRRAMVENLSRIYRIDDALVDALGKAEVAVERLIRESEALTPTPSSEWDRRQADLKVELTLLRAGVQDITQELRQVI